MIRFFLGWDSRETVAYHTLCHSLITRASVPITIAPLRQSTLREAGLYWRDPDPGASTEFSLTRFLVPYLVDYRGLAVFMDCDMLARVDPATLLEVAMAGNSRVCPDEAVWVVQHDYTPRAAQKFLGQANVAYPRKNWSSLIVFNTERCRALTLEYVNHASPADLHRFAWTESWRIGRLDLAWNVLVGEDNQALEAPKILHYTNGTPCFPEYADCDWADAWRAERDAMLGEGKP